MISKASVAVAALLITASVSAQSVKRSSNLRDSPSRGGVLLDALEAGAQVTLRSSARVNGYALVKTSDGKSGWVLATNLSVGATANGGVSAARARVQESTELFTQNCSAPAFPSASGTPIDSECPAEGTGSQPDEAQNSEKNNFCATGVPNAITIAQMSDLQKQVEAARTVNFGSRSDSHPFSSSPGPAVDRSPLTALGEGSAVVLVGYVLDAVAESAESVNCNLGKSKSDAALHDIHVTIVENDGETNKCSGVVAEMIPHHRPDAWTPKLLQQVKTEHRQVRLTGNLMFDSSHTECVNGSPLPGDPSRVALWEVHPIYKFEVCSTTSCDSGNGFVDLEAWKP